MVTLVLVSVPVQVEELVFVAAVLVALVVLVVLVALVLVVRV